MTDGIDVRKRDVFRRLLREAWLPATLAFGYAVWHQFSKSTPPSPSELVGVFGTAFFLIMWFVGQFVRVAKQLRTDRFLEDIHQGITRIEQGFRTATPEAPPTPEPATPPGAVVENTLAAEAEAAMQAGSPRAALMVAGAALEESLRRVLRAYGRDLGGRQSPARSLRQLDTIIEPDLAASIRDLWNIRNRVVHNVENDVELFRAAPSLLDAFLTAVHELSKVEQRAKRGGSEDSVSNKPSA